MENKPGAGTTIGNGGSREGKPDGYTLLFAPTPFVISQVVFPTLPYDPKKDFAPVSLLATSPFILVTNAAVPKRRPSPSSLPREGEARGAHVLLGGQRHGASSCRRALQAARRRRHRPRAIQGRRAGDHRSRRRAGEHDVRDADRGRAARAVGKLGVLGATSLKRLAAMPQVPTLAESGYPGFEIASFFGVLAPAGTPADIVSRLADRAGSGDGATRVRERFAAQSAEANVLGPEAFARFLDSERDKWADIVKRSGAKVD